VAVARLYAVGAATTEQLTAAVDAAWDAARAARAARYAVRAAWYASTSAWDAAWAAWAAAADVAVDADAADAAMHAVREQQSKLALHYAMEGDQ
jgi:hypothetical protein